MIEKLKPFRQFTDLPNINADILVDKINELADHLNTQEEKAKQTNTQIEVLNKVVDFDYDTGHPPGTIFTGYDPKYDTASNQSNTEPEHLYHYQDVKNGIYTTGRTIYEAMDKADKLRKNTKPVVLGVDPATKDGDKGCKAYGHYDGEKFVVTRYEYDELPQKIKLLKDRAIYKEGEYIYSVVPTIVDEGVKYQGRYEREDTEISIHPDIIKATSGQGIRSDLTDGEGRVSRQLEENKKATPDPYEECAKEISEYLLPSGYEDELVPILKKHFPPLS